MGDTGSRDSLEAPGCKDIGLDLWISLFIGFYSEDLLLVPVFIGSVFHMNHSFASEKLRGSLSEKSFGVFHSCRNSSPGHFHGRDVWFQPLQKQIDFYKSNKTPQQKNSKCNSRAVCPCQESLQQKKTWWGAVDHSGTISHTQRWQSTKNQRIDYSVW